MKTININFENKTIEMTKTFANKARQYGSDEYKQMLEACNAFPTYKLVTKAAPKKSGTTIKGLTYEAMEKYIAAHNSDLLSKFHTLIGKVESDDGIIVTASYPHQPQRVQRRSHHRNRDAQRRHSADRAEAVKQPQVYLPLLRNKRAGHKSRQYCMPRLRQANGACGMIPASSYNIRNTNREKA